MASWRDTASAQAQRDLDGLLNTVMPFAEQALGAHGEFFPYGATVTGTGETRMIAADPGLGERPESNAVLTALYEGAREAASSQRAVAFVADVRLDGSDAVQVELEHAEGVALVIALPYSRSRFKKAVTFGAPRASAGRQRIWTRA
jgi:hypothetical protein